MEINNNPSFNNNNNGVVHKFKLLCSYGGMIRTRKTDNQFHYAGGDTKIVAFDRKITLSEIVGKLNYLWPKIGGSDVSLKYQLPGQGLDSLVSLIDDDDVKNMVVEYDLMHTVFDSAKPARLRLFVFSVSSSTPPSPPTLPVKSETSDPEFLFGYDEEYKPIIGPMPDLIDMSDMGPPENCGSSRAFKNSVLVYT